MKDFLDELPPTVREHVLRPMTQADLQWQALSFAYGNLAASTNHRPVRAAFKKVALERGISEAEFETWADKLTWR